MTLALLKKQFTELFRSYFVNPKTGKIRSKKSIFGFFLLFASILGFLMFAFFGVSHSLAENLVTGSIENDWLYFAIMGMLSILLGAFGSVFNTYAELYKAKDNELLLSMPIPTEKIVFARVAVMYAMSLVYSALVWIPAIIRYGMVTGETIAARIYQVMLILIIALFVSVITALLGWIVALLSGKIKNKSIVSALFSVFFLALYYVVYFRINSILSSIVLYAEVISSTVKSKIFPIYMLGKAACGDTTAMIIFTIISAVGFALVYLAISKTFISLTTSTNASSKSKKALSFKSGSIESALYHKEIGRFFSSTAYMMNCGLPSLIMPVAAIALIIKRDAILENIGEAAPVFCKLAPAIAMACVFIISGMGCITAPSISLEGKYFWLIRSLPIEPIKVFNAKIKAQLTMIIIPAAILDVAICLCFNTDILTTILTLVTMVIYSFMFACTGLMLNLRMPNMTWTNETVPIKQSMPVLFSMIIGAVSAVATAGLGYLTMNFISSAVYVTIMAVVFGIFSAIIYNSLKKSGTKLIEEI